VHSVAERDDLRGTHESEVERVEEQDQVLAEEVGELEVDELATGDSRAREERRRFEYFYFFVK
jgi:hypothetical protein